MKGSQVKSLSITIVTGDDDLREKSIAYMMLIVPSRQPGGLLPQINLNHGKNWPNGSSNTVEWDLSASKIGIDDLSIFVLTHASHQRNIFDTHDNWNVDEITIVANCEDGPETIFQRAESPITRFTGSHSVESFAFQRTPIAA
jgi:hypothetical protein